MSENIRNQKVRFIMPCSDYNDICLIRSLNYNSQFACSHYPFVIRFDICLHTHIHICSCGFVSIFNIFYFFFTTKLSVKMRKVNAVFVIQKAIQIEIPTNNTIRSQICVWGIRQFGL